MSLSAGAASVCYMDHFIPLGLMGVRVVRCPQLGRDSVYFDRFDLLVIDDSLTEERCEEIACEVLGMVVSTLVA